MSFFDLSVFALTENSQLLNFWKLIRVRTSIHGKPWTEELGDFVRTLTSQGDRFFGSEPMVNSEDLTFASEHTSQQMTSNKMAYINQ